MANYGKISRLPRSIREELNRRLDDGEPGVQLLAWLNELPQVKKLIQADFEGRPITEVNLSDWKNHGFRDWQTQQELLGHLRDFKADGRELAAESDGELAEFLVTTVETHYAVALKGWNGEMTDELRARLRGLRGLCREAVRLRRSQQQRERMELEREKMALRREKAELERHKLELERRKAEPVMRERFDEWVAELQKRKRFKRELTEKEKEAAIQAILRPDPEHLRQVEEEQMRRHKEWIKQEEEAQRQRAAARAANDSQLPPTAANSQGIKVT